MKKITALSSEINLVPDKLRIYSILKTAQKVILVLCLLAIIVIAAFTAKGYIEIGRLNREITEDKRIIAEGHLDELNALKEQYDIDFQRRILFVAQDVDMIAALMCYIQLSLLGCSAVVKIGDSLTEPFTEAEPITEQHWFTPFYMLGDVFRLAGALKGQENQEKNESEKIECTTAEEVDKGKKTQEEKASA